MNNNPFAATEQPPNDDFAIIVPDRPGHLASRWRRLGGVLIDWMVLIALWLPVERALSGQWLWEYDYEDGEGSEDETTAADVADPSLDFSYLWSMSYDNIGTEILAMVLTLVVFLIAHGYMLAQRGQTIGKLLLGMRIVGEDGRIRPFHTTFGLRYGIMHVVQWIPGFSLIAVFIDPLLIFGPQRRCLHDLIAGTWVVRTEVDSVTRQGVDVAPLPPPRR